jgi:hypothetical protein
MKVFLETSIQIQRLLHTKARMEHIQRQLSSKWLCTSDYFIPLISFDQPFASLKGDITFLS